MSEKRWDVVIYEIGTRKIESIAGKDMKRDTGFTNAEKRMETVLLRINTSYSCRIVPAGKYQKGDELK